MAAPEIDFKEIRLHRGTKANAFEELCCQLASDLAEASGWAFNRKGPGPDAGLEAFAIDASGDETGWQVKYYWDMASALTSLTNSLTQALIKHPKLVRFVACLPIDLSDSRLPDVKTALERWETWKTAQIAVATDRTLSIERWDAHALKNHLTADRKAAGRIAFWFDQTIFDADWFRHQFDRSKATLGSRYTAETNLRLPMRRAIMATTRDTAFTKELGAYYDIIEGFRSRLPAAAMAHKPASPAETGVAAADSLARLLKAASTLERGDFPVDAMRRAARDAETAMVGWLQDLRSNNPRLENDDTRIVSDTRSAVQDVIRQLESDRWSLVNARRLLVFGEGGRGKSHLLADACEHQLDRGLPALLIPSNILEVKEPLGQIVELLDLPTHVRRHEFLSALNSAAIASGVRALLVIDGINERDGQTLWSIHLGAFLVEVEKHPWISLVLSCRTTYLDSTIPTSITESRLPRLEHHGFSPADADRYLGIRGIMSPEAPWPLEEFQTPLFLKTLCDGLVLVGQNTLPRGSNGLTQIFSVYSQAVVTTLIRDMRLNKSLGQVEQAITVLAEEIATTSDPAIPYFRAHQLVSAILPSSGPVDRDLLFQLIAAGMFSVNHIHGADFVRFTFDRYSDHVVAKRLLSASVQNGDAIAAAQAATPLYHVLHSKRPVYGLLEALAVQLPETYAVELSDLPSGGTTNYAISQAFITSLTTRVTSAFTNRTWELIEEEGSAGLEHETRIRLSTEDAAGADALHEALSSINMPKRDATWSVHIAVSSEAASHLIDWALQTDATRISAKRAEYAARSLTWMLSTTSRRHRDRATKALVRLFADHPAAARVVLSRFANVDDLYILERLLCSIYGAALQGRWPASAAAEVVTDVDAHVFRSAAPPVNILVRDHGRNFLIWADRTGVLPTGFNAELSCPPYASQWPIRHISEVEINSFTQTYASGYVSRDRIVASCVDDGDFARYVLDGAVDGWSPALRGTKPLPSREDVDDQWVSRFRATATPGQAAAYERLLSAIGNQAGHWPTREEKEAIAAAKDAFEACVGSSVFESWRAEAENWRRNGGMYQRSAPRDRAEFNLAWARRWVCWRAHDIGWSVALHQNFDDSVDGGRMDHSVERIGKKYQWLALYELRARMADNLEPVDASFGVEPEKLRNIDPSLLAGALPEEEDNERQLESLLTERGRTQTITLSSVTVDEALVWRDLSDDLPDTIEAIDRAVDGSRWLTLKGFQNWRGGPNTLRREISRWITCVVMDRASRPAFVALANAQPQFDHDSIGDTARVPWRSYLGEHPWRWGHGATNGGWINDWRPRQGSIMRPLRLRETTTAYLAETSGYDQSIRKNIDTRLPEVWLVDALGLRLTSGLDIAYSNAAGKRIYQDETPEGGSKTLAVIDRDTFVDLLARNDLSAVWLINGEKNVYCKGPSDAFGGRRYYSRVIWSDGGDLQIETRGSALSKPGKKQLAALRANNPT